ncbi:MAG: family 43 glycosylhydrolase [Mangrovibacterium sp.]
MKGLITILIVLTSLFSNAVDAKIPNANPKFDGYLFAYFDGKVGRSEYEQLRFAVSEDGFHWTSINNNRKIISSADISQTGGIRDPHILRKEDNSGFYMVATDMNTAKNGWDSNPGIVMMKSDSLTRWSSSIIDLAKLYPKNFGKVKWIWAPQTIYDIKAKKYLVYFTVRYQNDEKLDFYCAYANKDFTGFEKEPKLMFSPKYGGIDGDIVYKDGIYHFFYKGHTKDENDKVIKNGIQQATSKSLKGPWKEDFKYLDAYADKSTKVEGSSVFKLNNSNEYLLMYDVYSDGRFEFQRSKDLYRFTDEPESFTKNFNPRHGSVIGITKNEARLLQQKWGGVPASLLQPKEAGDTFTFESHGNPIIKHHFTADPAPFVHNDTVWMYTGHDMHPNQKGYVMKDWLLFSTADFKTWTEYPVPLTIDEFKWANSKQAYAAQVQERNGKWYMYVSTNWCGIGVAVADNPRGPFKDALGKPLLTNKDCYVSSHSWAVIDPAIYIDDNDDAWIFWGNKDCYYAKLKDNMIEIDGDVKHIPLTDSDGNPNFTEAPWVHKYKDIYYLTYASGWPEYIVYATSKSINGPWTFQGKLTEVPANSNTTHPAIIELKDEWYFIYHNGARQDGGTSYSRAVCAEKFKYEKDGTIKKIEMTSEGVQ